MTACIKAVDGNFRMIPRLCRDGADIGLFFFQHLAIIGVNTDMSIGKRTFILLRPLLCPFKNRITAGDKRDTILVFNRGFDVLETLCGRRQ